MKVGIALSGYCISFDQVICTGAVGRKRIDTAIVNHNTIRRTTTNDIAYNAYVAAVAEKPHVCAYAIFGCRSPVIRQVVMLYPSITAKSQEDTTEIRVLENTVLDSKKSCLLKADAYWVSSRILRLFVTVESKVTNCQMNSANLYFCIRYAKGGLICQRYRLSRDVGDRRNQGLGELNLCVFTMGNSSTSKGTPTAPENCFVFPVLGVCDKLSNTLAL